MTRDDAAKRRSAEVLLSALEVFEAATTAVSASLAIEPTRAAVALLDDAMVRDVAVALAVEAVWQLPMAKAEPVYAGDFRARLQQVRSWVQRMRLEASWVL